MSLLAVVAMYGERGHVTLRKNVNVSIQDTNTGKYYDGSGFNNASQAMFGKGGVDHTAPGVVSLAKGADGFIAAAKEHKIWARDEVVNPPR